MPRPGGRRPGSPTRTCARTRPPADDLVHDPAALIGVVGDLDEITGTRRLRTGQESHFTVLPGRLEAKRKGQSIDGHLDSGDTTPWTDGGAAAARRVPPPEIPGQEQQPIGAPTCRRRRDQGGGAGDTAAGAGVRARSSALATGPSGECAGAGWPEAPASAGAPARTGRRCRQQRRARRSAGGPRGGGPELRAAVPDEPFYLPAASWRWPLALIGLIVGAAPQALLTVAALLAGPSTSSSAGSISAGSAIALALGSLVLYGWEALAAWLFSLRSAGRSLVLWGFRRPTKAYFWVVPVGLIAVYAFSLAHDLIVNPKQQAIISDFPHTTLGAAMFVLVAVVMAPLFEEVIFRGFLFRGFANSWGWVWGALASAAIFGAAHLQLDVFLPLAALGFVLAWAYHRTGSLWTCITMHALFNLIAVAAWALTS